jgi:hypothetical protein
MYYNSRINSGLRTQIVRLSRLERLQGSIRMITNLRAYCKNTPLLLQGCNLKIQNGTTADYSSSFAWSARRIKSQARPRPLTRAESHPTCALRYRHPCLRRSAPSSPARAPALSPSQLYRRKGIAPHTHRASPLSLGRRGGICSAVLFYIPAPSHSHHYPTASHWYRHPHHVSRADPCAQPLRASRLRQGG